MRCKNVQHYLLYIQGTLPKRRSALILILSAYRVLVGIAEAYQSLPGNHVAGFRILWTVELPHLRGCGGVGLE